MPRRKGRLLRWPSATLTFVDARPAQASLTSAELADQMRAAVASGAGVLPERVRVTAVQPSGLGPDVQKLLLSSSAPIAVGTPQFVYDVSFFIAPPSADDDSTASVRQAYQAFQISSIGMQVGSSYALRYAPASPPTASDAMSSLEKGVAARTTSLLGGYIVERFLGLSSPMAFNTKEHPSTYLAMGFANVRAGTHKRRGAFGYPPEQ